MDETVEKQKLIEKFVNLQEAIFNQITLPTDRVLLKQADAATLRGWLQGLRDMACILESKV